MLLFREKIPADWLPKVLANLPAVLVDHAHWERKAATSALNLGKYRDLSPGTDTKSEGFGLRQSKTLRGTGTQRRGSGAQSANSFGGFFQRVEELNAIAIEELQHFQFVVALLKRRGIPFGQAHPSPWIAGLMKSARSGRREQVIDHLICRSLIEGRSCEKFQILAAALKDQDAELAQFYGSLVEPEGNHYATLLREVRRDVERRGYVFEPESRGRRVAAFEGPAVVQLLSDPNARDYPVKRPRRVWRSAISLW